MHRRTQSVASNAQNVVHHVVSGTNEVNAAIARHAILNVLRLPIALKSATARTWQKLQSPTTKAVTSPVKVAAKMAVKVAAVAADVDAAPSEAPAWTKMDTRWRMYKPLWALQSPVAPQTQRVLGPSHNPTLIAEHKAMSVKNAPAIATVVNAAPAMTVVIVKTEV